MKFDTNLNTGFKPFTVTMTFETVEEAKVWLNMMGWNITIPKVAEVPDDKRDMVTTQMSWFRQAIEKGLSDAS